MKKPVLLTVFLIIAAGLAVKLSLRRRTVSPAPFPCVATAKTGWLTAVTGQAMLRLEWGDGSGRVGVSEVGDVPTWEPRDEASVRALALKVLEPISAPIRSNTSDSVSLFAGCDGIGAPWRGESRGAASYQECLRPDGEGRIECLRRVHRSRDAMTDEAAGAVADRINAVATAGGIALVETSTRIHRFGPTASSVGSMTCSTTSSPNQQRRLRPTEFSVVRRDTRVGTTPRWRAPRPHHGPAHCTSWVDDCRAGPLSSDLGEGRPPGLRVTWA